MERQPYDRKYYARYTNTITTEDGDLFNIIGTNLSDNTLVILYAFNWMFPKNRAVLKDRYEVGFLKDNIKEVRHAIIEHRKETRNVFEYADLLEKELQKLLESTKTSKVIV